MNTPFYDTARSDTVTTVHVYGFVPVVFPVRAEVLTLISAARRSSSRTNATVREAAFNDGALRPFQRRTAALQGFRGAHVRPLSIADALMDGRTRNEFLSFLCIESNARLVRLLLSAI
jgi:hypothetical protein